MANVGGRNISVEIENVYEYRGSSSYTPEGLFNHLAYNLNMAQDMNSYKTDVSAIADKAVEIARDFVQRNGNVRTGALLNSIGWEPKDNGFRLFAKVPYSGHIEYGFTDRGGQKRGPWPYLRPAMRIAGEMSTGVIGDHAAQIILNGPGPYHLGKGKTGMFFGRHNINMTANSAVSKTAKGFGSKGVGNSKRTAWTGITSGAGYMSGKSDMDYGHYWRGAL